MEISFVNKTNVTFGDLLEGDTFIDCCEILHMKTRKFQGGYYERNDVVNAVVLETGNLVWFSNDAMVTKCNCKVDATIG